MNNLSRAGKTLIVVFVTVFALGSVVKLLERPETVYVYVQDPNIPSAREIQQRLKDLDDPRYDPGPIDGIPGPKMITGWDNLIKDRYAIRDIEGRDRYE